MSVVGSKVHADRQRAGVQMRAKHRKVYEHGKAGSSGPPGN